MVLPFGGDDSASDNRYPTGSRLSPYSVLSVSHVLEQALQIAISKNT
jgi:hypothetical protein